jgi:hypothetical protein
MFSTPKNMSKKLTVRLNVFIYFPLKNVYSKDIISSSSPQSTKTIKPCVIETSVPENSSMKKSIKLRLGPSITSLLHMYNVSAIHPFLPDEFWSTPLENRNASAYMCSFLMHKRKISKKEALYLRIPED